MGKYSTPATFQGAKQKGEAPGRGDLPRQYPKIDWGVVVDERVDVVAAMIEHVGVQLADKKRGDTRRQLRAKCPYPGCTSKEDGFSIWPHRSPKTLNHYYCRQCRQSGDIIKLLEEINGWDFPTTLEKLGLKEIDDQPHVRRGESPAQKQQREYEEWAKKQLEMLRHNYPRMRSALATHERPQKYLASRGISLEQAQRYGLGYLPAPQETGEAPHKDLWQWQGRIIFPLSGSDGELTFAGRSLALWQPGMTPTEHKAAIETWNAQFEPGDKRQVRRVHKTSPCGHFGYKEAVASECAEWKIPEGEFDALSLLLSGVKGVVAMGTGFDADLIPIFVERVALAMDADGAGMQAARKLADDLAGVGLSTRQVVPTTGKDWNDMFVSAGAAEISTLFDQAEGQSEPEEAFCSTCLDEGIETIALPEPGPDEMMYCEKHHPAYHFAPVQQLSPEQIADRIAASIPGGCSISDVPSGGIHEVAEEIARENREWRSRFAAVRVTPEEFWESTRRKLKGFKAVPPAMFQEIVARPQTYLYDFPRYELRQIDGIYQLYEVGTWLKDGGCIMHEEPRPMVHR